MKLIFSPKFIILALFIAYFSILGMGMGVMHMSESGEPLCPFDIGKVVCQMGISEHLSSIQNIFRSVVINYPFSLILLAAPLLFYKFRYEPELRQLVRIRHEKAKPFSFNKVLLALSDGILQPKLYH